MELTEEQMQKARERVKRLNQHTQLYNFLYYASRRTLAAVKMPYEIPKIISIGFEMCKEKRERTPAEIKQRKEISDYFNEDISLAMGRGLLTGLALGSCLDIAQAGIYGYLAYNGHPDALMIPVVTNVLSGAIEIGKNLFKRRERKREIHDLASQLQKAVTFSYGCKLVIKIPSTGNESLVYLKYTFSDPPRIRVETCWSQREALRPKYHRKEYTEFKVGERYLDEVFTDEVIGILEQRLSEKSKEIKRNLRRPKE